MQYVQANGLYLLVRQLGVASQRLQYALLQVFDLGQDCEKCGAQVIVSQRLQEALLQLFCIWWQGHVELAALQH